jgi:hypothetical protein
MTKADLEQKVEQLEKEVAQWKDLARSSHDKNDTTGQVVARVYYDLLNYYDGEFSEARGIDPHAPVDWNAVHEAIAEVAGDYDLENDFFSRLSMMYSTICSDLPTIVNTAPTSRMTDAGP